MVTTEQNKPSVLAKLMGLDEMRSQKQPVYKRRKVLSESYLQKFASIGLREKGSGKDKKKNRMVSKKANLTVNDSFEPLDSLRNTKNDSKPTLLTDSNTTYGWEFKKQLLERSKAFRYGKQGCNLGETLSMPNHEPTRRLELVWKDDKSVGELPIFRRFNFSYNHDRKIKKMCKSDVKSSCEKQNNIPSCGDSMIKQCSKQMACNDSEKGGSSCSSDVSFEQDSTGEDLHGFLSSNCVENDDELSKSTGEAYQPSPNSVLEPLFKEDNSSSSENGENVSTDLHGLWMKLQILKSESEQNNSKHETIASSDGDTSGQDTKPVRCLGPKEAREFSYLVDILEESGFHGNMERWHSLEHMINPLLFETLEKKHGKQESWSKADRRLLFDRIDSGLSEIVRPHVDFVVWSKPLRRRISDTLRRDIVEEELWRLLLRQETGVNAELSEKAVGREPWLELTDEVDSIVREIEGCLFDELANELIGI